MDSSLFQRIVLTLKPLVERFPTLAHSYRVWRDAKSQSLPHQVTPFGFHFKGNPAMVAGSFEPTETELFQILLPHFDVLINVGANIGYYCCIAAQEGKEVVAFEPMDSNFRALESNISVNGWKHVQLYKLGAGDSNQVLKIYGTGTGASLIKGWANNSELRYNFVQVLRLDDVIRDNFSGKRAFVLIDVEGAENMVLAGATNLLNQRPKPIFMIEISSVEHLPKGQRYNSQFVSTFEKMFGAGYDAWAVGGSVPVHLNAKQITDAAAAGQAPVQGAHNYLFLPKGGEDITSLLLLDH